MVRDGEGVVLCVPLCARTGKASSSSFSHIDSVSDVLPLSPDALTGDCCCLLTISSNGTELTMVVCKEGKEEKEDKEDQ